MKYLDEVGELEADFEKFAETFLEVMRNHHAIPIEIINTKFNPVYAKYALSPEAAYLRWYFF